MTQYEIVLLRDIISQFETDSTKTDLWDTKSFLFQQQFGNRFRLTDLLNNVAACSKTSVDWYDNYFQIILICYVVIKFHNYHLIIFRCIQFIDITAHSAFWDAQVSYDDIKNADLKRKLEMGQHAVIGTIMNLIVSLSVENP